MKRSEILFGLLRIPLDAVAVVGALLLAYWLRRHDIDLVPSVQLLNPAETLPPINEYVKNFLFGGGLAFIAVILSLRLYSLRVTMSAWKELWLVTVAGVVWLALITGWYFLVEKQLFFSRILLLHATTFAILFSAIGRSSVIGIQRALLRRGVGIRRVISCGSIELPPIVTEILLHDPRFRFVGHVGTCKEIDLEHAKKPIDLVFHTDPNPTSTITSALINYCRSHHIGYSFLPPVFADVPHQLSIDHLGLVPLLKFEPTPLDGWGRVWKRLFDLLGSIVLIVVLSPILLLIALVVLLFSGWPILYISRRVGQYGKSQVPILKFRTMIRGAEDRKSELIPQSHRTDGPLFKIKNDPRVTSVGKVLRRFSLDELPQLFNVLVGQLSLVGPRPHLPDEVARYAEHHRRVLTVRPGITGLAQVSGRSNLPFEEETQLDMRYIEDWSLLLDLWILWRTAFVVLFGKGAD